MSNQINHQRAANKRNQRQNERPTFASGCSGEGHNGQIGRSKWKKLSRRNERHALKEGRTPGIGKYIKKSYKVTPHEAMNMIGEFRVSDIVRKVRVPKPIIVDKIEDEY